MKLIVKIVACHRGGYIATCPSLPGCRTHGQTKEEAQRRLDEAFRGYIAAMSNFVPENLEHVLVEA